MSSLVILAAEREPITEVWGHSIAPRNVQRQSPWSRNHGAAKSPESESVLAFLRPMKAARFIPLTVSGKLSFCDVYSTLNV